MDKLRYAIVGGALALTAASAGAQNVPAGQLPSAGLCRVWINGVAAARQPHATDCVTARRTAPVNSRILYGGGANLRTGVNGQYDPRTDPRSPQYDPRYDPNASRNDPRNGSTYDPRYGTRRNGNHADGNRRDGDHGDGDDDDNDDDNDNDGHNSNRGIYDPRHGANGNGTYDSRMSQKDREKWEKKREKEQRKHHKGKHNDDRDDDDR